MTTTNVSRHRREGNIAPGGGPQCELPSIPPEVFLGANKEIDMWPQNQPEKLMSYVPQAPSGLFSVALDAYCRFQKAVLEEAFFSDLRSPVAKPILPEAGPALPEQGGSLRGVASHSWLHPLLGAGRREPVVCRLPSCMFRLQWPGDGPDRAGDPKVAGLLL